MNRRVKHLSASLAFGILLVGVGAGVSVSAAVEIGDRAPDFSLPSTSGDKVSLRQFRGKKHVLIHFYSMDFNPT